MDADLKEAYLLYEIADFLTAPEVHGIKKIGFSFSLTAFDQM